MKNIKKEYLKTCVDEEKGSNWFEMYRIPIQFIVELAKKEVFDDIDKFQIGFTDKKSDVRIINTEYEELKKRHLSTLPKAKRHNSDFKAHKSSPKDCPKESYPKCIHMGNPS